MPKKSRARQTAKNRGHTVTISRSDSRKGKQPTIGRVRFSYGEYRTGVFGRVSRSERSTSGEGEGGVFRDAMEGRNIRACCYVWKSFVPTEPRNTYLFRWEQSFVPRCPIDDGVHRLKKIYFFPPVQFVRNGSPCEWKTTFFLFFFFSYQLNELFFIRRQRYAISPLHYPFLRSVIDFYSFAGANFFPFFFFFFYFSFSLLSFPLLFFDSQPPSFLSSATYHPRLVSRVLLSLFFAPGPFSLLSSLHLHLLTVVRFLVFPRSFLFLNSYRRFFHLRNFITFSSLFPSLTLTRSLPFSRLYPPHEFFSAKILFTNFPTIPFPHLSLSNI